MRKCIVIVAILTSFLVLLPVSAQDTEGIAEITTPSEGEQLFGLVEIIGTVSHPSLFESYMLEWRNAQNTDGIWIPIQQPVSQQVTIGILGQWDTVAGGVPDGIYQIRLRMFLTDGSVRDVVVDNLVLTNSAPTQIPTPPNIQATSTLPVLNAGESPTPIIAQPPTVTPRPTFESPAAAVASDNGDGSELFNFNAVEDAFCSGVFFSVVLFAIIIAYLMLRSQLSPFTRRLWWQIRSEMEDNQRD